MIHPVLITGENMRKLKNKGNMNDRMDTVLRKFRARMTSYPPGMCPLALYRSLLQISMNQSCGKCVPCREGLGEVDDLLRKIINGGGRPEMLLSMESVAIARPTSSSGSTSTTDNSTSNAATPIIPRLLPTAAVKASASRTPVGA